jgi:hypothetical protein
MGDGKLGSLYLGRGSAFPAQRATKCDLTSKVQTVEVQSFTTYLVLLESVRLVLAAEWRRSVCLADILSGTVEHHNRYET